jgi:hypothetical protein
LSDRRSKHLVDLPGTPFSIWQWTSLRGTGFPAARILCLGAPALRVAVDARLDAEENATEARRRALSALRALDPSVAAGAHRKVEKRRRAEPVVGAEDAIAAYNDAIAAADSATAEALASFERERARISSELKRIAGDPLLREAVTWQNRAALETAFAPIIRRNDGAKSSSADRKHEALLARYLQRYCTKNDTIGFFGPLGWARWSSDGPPIALRPGANFLATRIVEFEQWGIDIVTANLAKDARLRPWMIPRRLPFVRLDGLVAKSALSGKVELSDRDAHLLAACDGRRSARELAKQLSASFDDEAALIEALESLAKKQLVTFTIELPLGRYPDRRLREWIERIDEPELRTEALRPLERLEAARAEVVRATGDADAVYRALGNLEATFMEVTGESSVTRRAGSMYAGRQLVYEDCRRDLEVTFGPHLLEALAKPLELLLHSARWLSFECAAVYRERLRELFTEMTKRSGAAVVPLTDFWLRAQRIFFGSKEIVHERAAEEVKERWSSVIRYEQGARRVELRSSEIRDRVLEVFRAPHPGWPAARHHSPDIMIIAKSADAIANDDYELVLGELHPAVNTLDTTAFVSLHPDPREIFEAFAADTPEPRVVTPPPKDWPGNTIRTSSPLTTPQTWILETGFDAASSDRDHVLALSDAEVAEVDGRLVVRGERLGTIEIVEFFGDVIAPLVAPSYRLLPKHAHTPRVTIDRLVVARESWTLSPEDFTFAHEADEHGRFVAARRFARKLGLPRFVFAKSTIEVKPVYIDLDSPLFVDALSKLARAGKEHVAGGVKIVLTEMLPATDESWLPDAAGERYTSELRLVAVDRSEK